MVKYIIKEAYALQASLSVLLDARKHIDAYPTQAADAGSDERTARHFLQRVLNSTASELAPTKAAAIALGVPFFRPFPHLHACNRLGRRAAYTRSKPWWCLSE